MDELSILVMSDDGYDDTWEPFFTCLNKYWPNHPTVYLSTQTKHCAFATTINKNYHFSMWTRRMRETIEEIPTNYVLLVDCDMFLKESVDENKIKQVLDYFTEEIACFNFQPPFDPYDMPSSFPQFSQRRNRAPYLNSCQPSIHNRQKLIERMDGNKNAWEWELTTVDSPYRFYINSANQYYSFNYHHGLSRGKWKQDTKEFFEAEGINLDLEIRGYN